jgi:hypothetical protein
LWKLEEYSFNISNKNKAECRILKRLQYKGGPLSKQVLPGYTVTLGKKFQAHVDA